MRHHHYQNGSVNDFMIQTLTPDTLSKTTPLLIKPHFESLVDNKNHLLTLLLLSKAASDVRQQQKHGTSTNKRFLHMDISFRPLSGFPIPAASSASSCVCGAGPDITLTLQSSKACDQTKHTPQQTESCCSRVPEHVLHQIFHMSANGKDHTGNVVYLLSTFSYYHRTNTNLAMVSYQTTQ